VKGGMNMDDDEDNGRVFEKIAYNFHGRDSLRIKVLRRKIINGTTNLKRTRTLQSRD